MDREESVKRHLTDLYRRAYDRGIIVFSDFLDLYELNILQSLPRSAMLQFSLWGGFDEAERQMAAFLPDAFVFPEKEDYPITSLRIAPLQARFAGKMTHRDYLGALMHLGIDRSVLGDILVSGDEAYVFCEKSMAALILQEITSIGRTSVSVTEADPSGLPAPSFETVSAALASLRLDCFLAQAFQLSRSRANALVEGGQVFVNSRLITTNACNLHEGDRISLRGFGKCVLESITGLSKKGKTRVIIKKYV